MGKIQNVCYYFTMIKEDKIASGAIGFLIALLILIIKFSGTIPHLARIPFLELSLLIFPFFFITGMWLASALARRVAVFLQLTKFLYVGALNTFVDLAILNVLIWFSGISFGFEFSLFKGVSFIAAVINSYVWNKFWTFKKYNKDSKEQRKEFLQFLTVSAIGFFLNVAAASIVVNSIGPQFDISQNTWATVGALAGTFVVFTWNFLGYKLIVFRK